MFFSRGEGGRLSEEVAQQAERRALNPEVWFDPIHFYNPIDSKHFSDFQAVLDGAKVNGYLWNVRASLRAHLGYTASSMQ